MPEPKHMPARVKALAEKIGDEPLDWSEKPDGSIVIVFCNKGKQTFMPEPEEKPRPIIHTKAEAEEAVSGLPKRKAKEK